MKTSLSGNDKIAFTDYQLKKERVPDVRGMGLSDAMYLLENQGMVVHSEGYGSVVGQSVAPGARTVAGGLIELKLKPN